MDQRAPIAGGTGFIRAVGPRLVDGEGVPIQLRGVGLGNWLLPEGYMWRFGSRPLSPRAIEAFVEDLVGPGLAEQFWDRFRAGFITEADIERIAQEGFDHVRLPLNSRTMLDGDELGPHAFVEIDRLIEWCRHHGLMVVLDLHGAPGGQTGSNIDDSPNGTPELFESTRYREQTVRIWRAIAERYAEETTVAGYDLLNEPVPKEWHDRHRVALVDLYQEITAAIRTVDRNHLLIYEGTNWATDFAIFDAVWDANSALQFHKYWSPPDAPSIGDYLEARTRLQLPLYMGEGGENNDDWIAVVTRLYEDHSISWCFWPWKKIDTTTSPASVSPPEAWSDLIRWAEGEGPKPAAAAAWRTLEELLAGLPFDRNRYRREIIGALFHRAPLELPAIAYGFRGDGVSFAASDRGDPGRVDVRADEAVTITQRGPNPIDFRAARADGSSVERRLVVHLADGEWVEYSVATRAEDQLRLAIDGSGAAPSITVTADGVREHPRTWSIALPAQSGEITFRIAGNAGGTSIERLTIGLCPATRDDISDQRAEAVP